MELEKEKDLIKHLLYQTINTFKIGRHVARFVETYDDMTK